MAFGGSYRSALVLAFMVAKIMAVLAGGRTGCAADNIKPVEWGPVDGFWESKSCNLDVTPSSVTADSLTSEPRSLGVVLSDFYKTSVNFPSKFFLHCSHKSFTRSNERVVRRLRATLTKEMGIEVSYTSKIKCSHGCRDIDNTGILFTDDLKLAFEIIQEDKDKAIPRPVVYYKSVLDAEQLIRGLDTFRSFYKKEDYPEGFRGGFDWAKARQWVEGGALTEAYRTNEFSSTQELNLAAENVRRFRGYLSFLVIRTTNFSFSKFEEGIRRLRSVFLALMASQDDDDDGALPPFAYLNEDNAGKSNCWVTRWIQRGATNSFLNSQRGFVTRETFPAAAAAGVRHLLTVDDNACTGLQMSHYLSNAIDKLIEVGEGQAAKGTYVIHVAILYGTPKAAERVLNVVQGKGKCAVEPVSKERGGTQAHKRFGVDILREATCGKMSGSNIQVSIVVMVYRAILPIMASIPEKYRDKVYETLQANNYASDLTSGQVSTRFDWKVVDVVSMPSSICDGEGGKFGTNPTRADFGPSPIGDGSAIYRWIQPACPPYKQLLAREEFWYLKKFVKAPLALSDKAQLALYCDTLPENRYGPSFAFTGVAVGRKIALPKNRLGPRAEVVQSYYRTGDEKSIYVKNGPPCPPDEPGSLLQFFPDARWGLNELCPGAAKKVAETVREKNPESSTSTSPVVTHDALIEPRVVELPPAPEKDVRTRRQRERSKRRLRKQRPSVIPPVAVDYEADDEVASSSIRKTDSGSSEW